MLRRSFLMMVVMVLGMEGAVSAAAAAETGERSRYLFFQQTDAMCTIAPMLNRERAQVLKKIGIERAFEDPMLALNRRQWFGESFRFLFAWRKFLVNFMHTPEGAACFKAAANQGLVTPHFYTRDGVWLAEDKEDCEKYPFFFADLKMRAHLAGAVDAGTEFYVPLGRETDDFSGELIYNEQTKIFDQFSYDELQINPAYGAIKASLLPRDGVVDSLLPIREVSVGERGVLGFRWLGDPHSDWTESFDNKMPYCLGLLKLMFLALGINNNNECIDGSEAEEATAAKAMKKLIQEDVDRNPWSDKFFAKEFFMQYALAEIFKMRPDLYESAAKVVDVGGEENWQTYQDIVCGKLELYKDAHGTRYDLAAVKRFLPGEHQTLAYFFTRVLRHLWYGAASKDAVAFYKAAGVAQPGWLAKKVGLTMFDKVKKQATKKIDGVSFFSVWAELQHELLSRCPTVLEWVSFDDHGWVISFDPDFIARQNNEAFAQGCDYELLHKLEFAGIESWWGHELEVFYKVKRPVATTVVTVREGWQRFYSIPEKVVAWVKNWWRGAATA